MDQSRYKFLFQVVHRTLAAMIASTMSVAILAAMNEVGTSYILRNFCVLICGMRVNAAVSCMCAIENYELHEQIT
jgi:ABC-type Fe3+ transport system permease subunit